MSDAVQQFWDAFCATLPSDKRLSKDAYDAWGFGDSAAMADELGDLVRRGVKTATASLYWEYEAEDEPLPEIGQRSIILDGQGNPLCIIVTTEVFVRPFNQFDAQFAYDEGEGDRSLDYWRDGHWAFFSRACAAIGRTPEETMLVVGERFRVVYPVTRT
jgi:uncharacterized protein YhfF